MGRFGILFLVVWCCVWCSPAGARVYSDQLDKADVRRVVTDVAAWQIEAYPRMDEKRYWKSNGDLSWENGVFLSALASWAEFDGNGEFIEWYESVCERNRYQLSGGANRIYFADDLAVALMYARLYMKRHYSSDGFEAGVYHESSVSFGFLYRYASCERPLVVV